MYFVCGETSGGPQYYRPRARCTVGGARVCAAAQTNKPIRVVSSSFLFVCLFAFQNFATHFTNRLLDKLATWIFWQATAARIFSPAAVERSLSHRRRRRALINGARARRALSRLARGHFVNASFGWSASASGRKTAANTPQTSTRATRNLRAASQIWRPPTVGVAICFCFERHFVPTCCFRQRRGDANNLSHTNFEYPLDAPLCVSTRTFRIYSSSSV